MLVVDVMVVGGKERDRDDSSPKDEDYVPCFGRHTVKISVALIRARCPMTGISNVNYDKTSGTKKMAEIGKEYLIVGKNDIHFTLTAFNRETAEHDYHYSWSHHYLYESLECPFHAEFLIERQLHIVISEGDN
ncbi:uncharacterized protein EV420DRAFT_1485532 [Desarmillaria tabescens]|uniref:Uncharacterized protein n=1 Tax=Armillaria tabescens TaxID=1929756 RepID=A0AA39JG50_ARMTA|nr:uncharacterized protein EV420DRAFT_1485532 [Desarmillaria tabescens]KAK0441794.1 hypothetical protein EV420DRAFT_1485532 [Desarmillaria tabescens]